MGGHELSLWWSIGHWSTIYNSPVLELDQFHVEHFDALHALHDRIEDQPNAVLGQIYYYIHAQGILIGRWERF